jgi:NADPH-dependent curcumin reductase CurA
VEDFDILFATNVRGPFFLVQQLLHCLGEGSNIIVISSIGAHAVVGKPGLDNPSILAYAATKGALETLVKNWAAILGPKGIRVNAVAAGAVGSLAGQLATIARARAVGIAGGPNKCAFVKEELGFDIAVDYKATGFPEALAMACPDGVDVYFENVGGAVWQAVLPLLNQFARVPVSGIIAHYDGGYSSGDDLLPEAMRQVIAKRLSLRGFINYDFAAEYFLDFVRDVSEWLKEGRIHYREHIVDELENARRPSSACSTVRIWAKLWSACHSV